MSAQANIKRRHRRWKRLRHRIMRRHEVQRSFLGIDSWRKDKRCCRNFSWSRTVRHYLPEPIYTASCFDLTYNILWHAFPPTIPQFVIDAYNREVLEDRK